MFLAIFAVSRLPFAASRWRKIQKDSTKRILMIVANEISAKTFDYAELAQRLLEADHCALVVIDIQQRLLPPIFQKEQLVRNAQLLIRAAGILKIPTLLSTQYSKGLGETVPEVSSLLSGTEAIDKTL